MKTNTTKNNKVKNILKANSNFWSLADKVKILAEQDYIFDMTITNKETSNTTCLGFNYCDRVLTQVISAELETVENDFNLDEVCDMIRDQEAKGCEFQIIYNSGVECIIL